MSEGWYPAVESYYVEQPDAEEFPVRQGDLMMAPKATPAGSKKAWLACVVVHPTCEVGAKREPADLQVIRVLALRSAPENAQADIVLGMRADEDGPLVAWAHTFFLPPVADLEGPMFADFRQLARIPRDELSVDRRIAALTHDARAYFIRRKLYWEQRWLMELEDVFGYERVRISNDANFTGSKPDWAKSESG